MLSVACFVVLAHVAGALLLSWGYFRRYTVARPPIGVFNLVDVAIMLLCIVLVPVFYLLLPRWLVAALLAAAALSVLSLTWEPVLRARWAIWLVTILLVAADIALALGFGAMSTPSLLANNAVLVVMAVGLTNLWTQSGMQARAVVLLGATLLIYDFVATSRLGHMDDLFSSLAGLPLAPLIAWPVRGAQWLGIGLGDVLLATVFPLVLRKAFGRPAGLVALMVGLGAIGVMLALLDLRVVRVTLPAMVVLGPMMLLQYGYWRCRRGVERTTWQYLQAEPKT